MEASIEQFATRYNVRLRKDSCGDMIAGKPPKPRTEDRSHVFEPGSGKLGLCLLLESRDRRWQSKDQTSAGCLSGVRSAKLVPFSAQVTY